MHLTNFFFNILNISMHPYLKLNYDFLGLKSLLDNLGFSRGSQTLTSSSNAQAQDSGLRTQLCNWRSTGLAIEEYVILQN